MVGLLKQIVSSSRILFLSTGSKQSVVVIIGSLIASGVSALSLILISRMLGPEKFGEFSVGLAVALILNRINDMGLAFAVQRYVSSSTDKTQQSRIVSYVTKIKLIGTIIIAVLGIVGYQWLADVLHLTNPNILLIAFIFQSFTVLFEHLQSVLQAFHRFWQLVIINLAQSTTKLIGALSLFSVGAFSSFSLLSMYLLAPLLPVVAFRYWLPLWLKIDLRNLIGEEKSLVTNMAKHSAIMLVSAGIIENIDLLFVQRYLTTYETGVLSGMSKIALLFMIIAFSLGNVLNPRVARYKERVHLQPFLKKSWLVVAVSIIGFLLSTVIAKYLVILSIGTEYLGGLPILYILLASSFIAIATIPFISIFFSVDAPWYFSVIGAVQLILTLGGNALFVPEHGLSAAAWTRLVTKVIAFVLTIILAQIMIDKQYGKAS